MGNPWLSSPGEANRPRNPNRSRGRRVSCAKAPAVERLEDRTPLSFTLGVVVPNPVPFKFTGDRPNSFDAMALDKIVDLGEGEAELVPVSRAAASGSVRVLNLTSMATRLDQADALGNLGEQFLATVQAGAAMPPLTSPVLYKTEVRGGGGTISAQSAGDARRFLVVNYDPDGPMPNGTWGVIAANGTLAGGSVFMEGGRFDVRGSERPLEIEGTPPPGGKLGETALGPLVPVSTSESTTPLAAMTTGLSPSAQLGSLLEPASTGWVSYVTTGGWGTSALQSSAFRSADDPVTDDGALTAPPAQVDPPKGSLSEVFIGPDGVSLTAADETQQVTELVPLPGSSLALIATLWTVSPDGNGPLVDWAGTADAAPSPQRPNAAAPPWAGFVMGLDDAIEASGTDVRALILSDSPNSNAQATEAFLEALDDCWPFALVPDGPASEVVGSLVRKARTRRADEPTEAALDQALPPIPAGLNLWTSPRDESMPGSDEGGKLVTSSAVSLLSVSASALLLTRAWRKRKRHWRVSLKAWMRRSR